MLLHLARGVDAVACPHTSVPLERKSAWHSQGSHFFERKATGIIRARVRALAMIKGAVALPSPVAFFATSTPIAQSSRHLPGSALVEIIRLVRTMTFHVRSADSKV